MNRACLNCGRIITFPDIPLPQNYTQKCNACGYNNPAGDELEMQPPSSQPSVDDSWSATFDSAIERGFSKPTAQKKKANPEPQVSASLKAPMVSKAELEAALNQLREELMNSFSHTVRNLETRVTQEASITREVGDPLLESEYPGFQREIKNHVAYRETLVCTQSASLIQTCETQLRDQGFTIHPLTNLEAAGKVLAGKNYHMMILDQNFFRGEEGMALLTQIKQTPLEIRRCQVIILVSPNIASCEPQIFYQWGLDMNIHPKDLDQLGAMLKSLMNLRAQMLGPYLATPKLG